MTRYYGNKSSSMASATLNSVTYGIFAGQGSLVNGVVSIDDTDKERQLINVAAGEVSSNRTDAIDGIQPHAINVVVGNVANSVTTVSGGDVDVGIDSTIFMSNTGESMVHNAIVAAYPNLLYRFAAAATD